MDDLIMSLDELGVTYTEDYESGTLTIDIADIDKATLVDVIVALNAGGYLFDITDTSITVETATYDMEDVEEEDAALAYQKETDT